MVGENVTQGIINVEEAVKIAEAQQLDLVEIAPSAVPPVCKVIDYKKFLYSQKKKQKEIKAKTAKVVVKELRFGPNTDDHDFNFKTRHAQNFLQEGAKIKAYVVFKGREFLFKNKGEVMLLKLAEAVEEWGMVEQLPRFEGRRMIMIMAPKKKK